MRERLAREGKDVWKRMEKRGGAPRLVFLFSCLFSLFTFSRNHVRWDSCTSFSTLASKTFGFTSIRFFVVILLAGCFEVAVYSVCLISWPVFGEVAAMCAFRRPVL